ncbi:hypothetical protein GCM10022408_24160 [Hymenobacter fastidiosus]|uniref:AsmA-like C-terminal domain-containing protein n=2 Tax=Hymenobacter fastidiosus TaxID=486264 RepID=A0ABP7SFF0_9BACT
MLVIVALGLLDPWLRRTLEQQVTVRTQGRYRLRIGQLHTSLWHRAIQLQGIQLRPVKDAAQWSDTTTLPHLLAGVSQLRVSGVGLWAALRGQVVPVDSVVLAGVTLRVLHLPRLPKQPLYALLPAHIPGLRIGWVGAQNVRAAYGARRQPTASLRRARAILRDVLLSPAGAADTLRLAYAAWVEVGVAGLAVRDVSHHWAELGRGEFSSRTHCLSLDALRITALANPRQGGGAPKVGLTLPHLRLTGIRTTGLRHRRLALDSLLLTTPRLTLTPGTRPPLPLPQRLRPYLRQLTLAHLHLTNGFVRVAGQPLNPTIHHLTLTATDLRVGPEPDRAAPRILYARAWEARTGLITATPVPYYRAVLGRLHLATRTGLLEAAQVALTPTVTPYELARRQHRQVPHLTVRLPRLRASALDYAALMRGAVRVGQVVLEQPRIWSAGDARLPLNPAASSITPETLGRLPFRFDIRRLRIRQANVYTSYVAPKGGLGRISLNRLDATLTNFTNDPRRMTTAHPAVVRASGWLQNQCRIQLTIWAPLLDPNGTHRGEATFGSAPFTLFNPMTEPTRMVRFAQGRIDRIRVRLRVNRQGAQGSMRAEYHGLKLALLSRHGGGDQRNLLTKAGATILNGLVVRDNNPARPG